MFPFVIFAATCLVVQLARREVKIAFWEYLRARTPLTLLTLAAGAAWLQWWR